MDGVESGSESDAEDDESDGETERVVHFTTNYKEI